MYHPAISVLCTTIHLDSYCIDVTTTEHGGNVANQLNRLLTPFLELSAMYCSGVCSSWTALSAVLIRGHISGEWSREARIFVHLTDRHIHQDNVLKTDDLFSWRVMRAAQTSHDDDAKIVASIH